MADELAPSKTSPDHIRRTFERYCEFFTSGDVDGVVALYHEDATVEDPIDSPVHRGSDAIRAFYQASAGTTSLELDGRVRMAGREGACAMVASPRGAKGVYIDTLDVMTFDDEGLITSMRAYWSPDTIRNEPGD